VVFVKEDRGERRKKKGSGEREPPPSPLFLRTKGDLSRKRPFWVAFRARRAPKTAAIAAKPRGRPPPTTPATRWRRGPAARMHVGPPRRKRAEKGRSIEETPFFGRFRGAASTKDRCDRRQTAGAPAPHHARHALAAGARGTHARRPATPEKGRKGAIYRGNALFRSLSGCGEHQRPLRSPPNRGGARPPPRPPRAGGGGPRHACTCGRRTGKGAKRADLSRKRPFSVAFGVRRAPKTPPMGAKPRGRPPPVAPTTRYRRAPAARVYVRSLGRIRAEKGPFSREVAEWPSLATPGAPGRPPATPRP
jgi:hypothetical protein